MLVKKTISGVVSIILLSLCGCAAISTEIEHGSLQTSTKMSSSIFLPPSKNPQIIYVQVKNTTDQQISLKDQLLADLKSEGYTITTDPDNAYEMVQVNILQAGKTSLDNINSAVADGFGGAVVGAAIGIGTSSNSWAGGAVGGIVGGLASAAADAFVQNVTYSVITDVQVSVRLPKGSTATQTVASHLKQGSGTMVSSNYSSASNMQQYQTRIISYADKVNLKFPDAEPALSKSLASEIAEIFSN